MSILNFFLIIAFSLSIAACNKDGGGSSKKESGGSIEGMSVGVPLYKAMKDEKARKNQSQVCQDIKTKYQSNNYEFMTISFLEKGNVYYCPLEDSWRSKCKKIGTYSGNVVSSTSDGEKLKFELQNVDSKTMKIVSATANGKKVDLNKMFATKEDLIAKKVSKKEIEFIVDLLKVCGIR